MIEGQLFDGKYKILKMLGQGGMSRVYLAENIKLGTLWAIKEMQKNPQSKIDMLVEPNILKKLNHPSLPRIFDIIEDDTSICVIKDYIDGISLDKELRQAGSFSEDTVLKWARQICEVLAYLHDFKPNPIIYRDLKPSNIIDTGDGSVKLIDFGIAREYKNEAGSDTIYIGTRGYAAPEQYGGGQTGAASDIYSLGVTLFHLLTGKSPNEPPYELQPVRIINRSLSKEIEEIICKCTKNNPAERYQSVQEILSDIDNIGKPDSGDGPAAGTKNSGGVKNVRQGNFKKLVLTVWDNPEFGCEFAYLASRLTGHEVLLIDLDLMAPSADLHLNLPKYPDKIISDNLLKNSGLDIVMDSLDKSFLTADILKDASVARSDIRNLYVLTGNYRLENYEYFNDNHLGSLIEKAYQDFDITVLLVNRSIYDSYTIISLIKSDYNIIPLRADIDRLREFNSCLLFLKEKQGIPLNKTKFIAFEYKENCNLNPGVLEEVSGRNFLGCIRFSEKRARYRNLKISFARRMDKGSLNDYARILAAFNILPRRTLRDKLKSWLHTRRVRAYADNKYSS